MVSVHWSDRLRALAEPVLGGGPPLKPVDDVPAWIEGFRDDHGYRHPQHAAFLAMLLGSSEGVPAGRDLDARLWHGAATGQTGAAASLVDQTGPLAPIDQGVIEVWTETELSGLQALRALARRTGRDELAARALDAAAWHVDNTQPDNATNRPWGVNVFVELAHRTGSVEAEMYVQTLVHNTLHPRGRPERFSAFILLEASRGLAEIGL